MLKNLLLLLLSVRPPQCPKSQWLAASWVFPFHYEVPVPFVAADAVDVSTSLERAVQQTHLTAGEPTYLERRQSGHFLVLIGQGLSSQSSLSSSLPLDAVCATCV